MKDNDVGSIISSAKEYLHRRRSSKVNTLLKILHFINLLIARFQVINIAALVILIVNFDTINDLETCLLVANIIIIIFIVAIELATLCEDDIYHPIPINLNKLEDEGDKLFYIKVSIAPVLLSIFNIVAILDIVLR